MRRQTFPLNFECDEIRENENPDISISQLRIIDSLKKASMFDEIFFQVISHRSGGSEEEEEERCELFNPSKKENIVFITFESPKCISHTRQAKDETSADLGPYSKLSVVFNVGFEITED